jgi:hypothetical protein
LEAGSDSSRNFSCACSNPKELIASGEALQSELNHTGVLKRYQIGEYSFQRFADKTKSKGPTQKDPTGVLQHYFMSLKKN